MSTTAMSEAGEFAGARLKEDKAAAETWLPFGNPDAAARANLFARHDPERLLRETEFKLLILKLHTGAHECCSYNSAYKEIDNCYWVMEDEDCTTALAIAAMYDQHSDYKERWRPNLGRGFKDE